MMTFARSMLLQLKQFPCNELIMVPNSVLQQLLQSGLNYWYICCLLLLAGCMKCKTPVIILQKGSFELFMIFFLLLCDIAALRVCWSISHQILLLVVQGCGHETPRTENLLIFRIRNSWFSILFAQFL